MKRLTFLLIVFILFSFESNKAKANLTDGLIAYYTFSGNANDISGKGHNGTVYGASLTSDRFGNPNSAYKFDGVDDYILVNYHTDFQLPTYTISAWIKPIFDDTSFTFGLAIVSRGEDFSSDNSALSFGVYEPVLDFTSVYLSYENSSDDDFSYITHEIPEIDEWVHLAVTRANNGTLSIYLDGDLLDSWDSTPVPTSNCTQDVTIGAYWYSPTSSDQFLTNWFWGDMDDLRIYNRALSESDLDSLSVIPVPSALILGSIGFGFVNWMRRRKTI